MAGTWTDIISITAPSSAAGGETVPVTVKVKNIHRYSIYIPVTAKADGISMYFSPTSPLVAAGATKTYSSSFIMPNKDVVLTVKSWIANYTMELDDTEIKNISLAEVFEGTITEKELDYEDKWQTFPLYGIPAGTRIRVRITGRNDMTNNQKMGIHWIIEDPDGYVWEYSDWETFWTGPGNAQEFIGGSLDLDKVGTYTINIALSMNPADPEIVDTYYGNMCTVVVVIPLEWTIIGSDITLAISVIPEVPPEWAIIGSDITLAISVIPEVPLEWAIIGADITLVINTTGVPLPPCTLGETKCIGPDLYECNLEGEWILAEKDSPECVVEEEKEFPWLLVAGGLGAAALVVAATTKKKKPAKEKRA